MPEMAAIPTKCRVDIYEQDGKDTEFPHPIITVESHRICDEFVVLVIGKERYTVSAEDLTDAIRKTT